MLYWTDSMNALQSIKNKKGALKRFAGNRIANMLTELLPTQWNYIKTDDNPAYLPSTGLAA